MYRKRQAEKDKQACRLMVVSMRHRSSEVQEQQTTLVKRIMEGSYEAAGSRGNWAASCHLSRNGVGTMVGLSFRSPWVKARF